MNGEDQKQKHPGGRPRNRVFDLKYRTGGSTGALVTEWGAITDRDSESAIGIARAFCSAHGVKFIGIQERLHLTRDLIDMDPTTLHVDYPLKQDRFLR
jgi:hypothetical protein